VSTTSLKLPDQLKKRVIAAAQGQGMTAHAFMVQAIEASAKAAEFRAEFVAQAEKARKAAIRTGKGYEAKVVHEYLRARIEGRPAARPKSVSRRG
jgi:predicted transcriptional regulator